VSAELTHRRRSVAACGDLTHYEHDVDLAQNGPTRCVGVRWDAVATLLASTADRSRNPLSFLQENDMSDPTRPYEPLTSENAVLILIDHQVGLMTGVRDYSTGELKHNVVGLAKAAKALKLPIIVTTTARDSMWGPTFPELVEALTHVPIIDRSSVNAFATASAESPWRKIVSFFRYFALVLPPSAWDRKDSRTKGCFLLVFTDKLPRLIRAACEPDRVVSAISSSRRSQSKKTTFRHLAPTVCVRGARLLKTPLRERQFRPRAGWRGRAGAYRGVRAASRRLPMDMRSLLRHRPPCPP
jgi:hypothetical protein